MSEYRHHSEFPKERLRWLYLWPYACFACRASFKRPYGASSRKCPNCGREAFILSRNFRPPKRTANTEWAVVEFLHSKGFRYQHIYDERFYVKYPTSMGAARDFVTRYASQAFTV